MPTLAPGDKSLVLAPTIVDELAADTKLEDVMVAIEELPDVAEANI
jgi:hypothetical protein